MTGPRCPSQPTPAVGLALISGNIRLAKSDDLLPAHFRPPKIRSDLLPRPGLVEEIRKTLNTVQTVLVVAASGYGKTTILTELHEQLADDGQQAIWLNITERKRDAGWLSRALAQMLALHLGVQSRANDDFAGLASKMIDPDDPLVVIIDNWNFLDDEGVARLFETIIAESEGLVQFVISSRDNPSFNFDAMRLAGRLEVITAEKLALTAEQSLQIVKGDCTASNQVRQLVEKTEGWPAGVQMLKLTVANLDGDQIEAFDFSGSQADVARYLHNSFLGHLPDKQKEMLLDIALFDEITSELVESVLGNSALREFLSFIEDSHFISENGVGSGRYRLHSLLRDYLNKRREELGEDGTHVLAAAAAHLREGDNVDDAIPLAIAAGQFNNALDMLDDQAQRLTSEGKVYQFCEWVAQIEQKQHAIPNNIRRRYVWALVFSGRLPDAKREADKHPEALDAEINIVLGAFSDDTNYMDEGIAAWSRELPDGDHPFRSAVIHCGIAVSLMADGQFGKAMDSVIRADFFIERTDSVFGRVWVSVFNALGQMFIAKGEQGAAALERAIRLGERTLGPRAPVVSVARQTAAILAFHRCDHGMVRSELEAASFAGTWDNLPAISLWADWIAQQTGVSWRSGSVEKMVNSPRLDLLQRSRKLGSDLRGDVSPELAQSLLHQYQLAAQQARKTFGNKATQGWQLDLIELANQARVYLIEAEPKKALALLSPAIHKAQRNEDGLMEVRLSILKAAALLETNNEAGATRQLIRAAEKAVEGRLFQSFVADRKIIEPLLPALAEAGARAPIGDQTGWDLLCSLLKISTATSYESARGEILEELTDREKDLLKLLELGMSNKEIARRTAISIPTVKWHLHNLFGKLGVRNRGSAVRVAQSAGLI